MAQKKSKKFLQVINHEINKRRISVDSKYIQERNKRRTYKLKTSSISPQIDSSKIYLYSNISGNQFILSKKQLQAANFPDSQKICSIVGDIHTELNKQIYKLWVTNKQYRTKQTFYYNKHVIKSSWILVILLMLAIVLLKFFFRGLIDQYQELVDNSLFVSIVSIIIVNVAFFINTITQKYVQFNFDNEIVKIILQILTKYEQNLRQYRTQIICDKEITWICFKYNDPSIYQIQGDAVLINNVQSGKKSNFQENL